MPETLSLNIPMDRVEGDIEIKAQIEDGKVVDAQSSGIMYRGFETILNGRGALDGLVISPRICGICTTAHLSAAVFALDAISGARIPGDATRIRNVGLMAEHIQSDLRQGFLMFTVDFANPLYSDHDLFEEIVRRYEPFKGDTVREVIIHTKKMLEIIAIIGGQWPHSSYMVPGGIASIPSKSDIIQCQYLLWQFRKWYEKRILGCALERWAEIKSVEDLEEWLQESESHRNSDIGCYIQFARQIGLDKIGRSHGNFVSYGALSLPEDTAVRGRNSDRFLLRAGFSRGSDFLQFDQEKISEHIACSWYIDDRECSHPYDASTRPYATGREGKKYSWSKAPRYNGFPAETGPLAEMIIAGEPLFLDLIGESGENVFVRELARLVRTAYLLPVMETWFSEITGKEVFYINPGKITEGKGFGLTEASRGALGHWVKIKDARIEHYQVITPTTWNASPRDNNSIRGPIEEALVGTEVKDASNPVELGHVVRSFDPCLVCTVH